MRHFITIIFLIAFQLINAQVKETVQIGEYHKLYSKILNEERQFLVGLPQNYQPESKSYAVVVLLDGDYHFISAYGNIEYLSKRFLMPEAIIVALPSTNRVRDLTPTNTTINFNGSEDKSLSESGGSTNFLKFIEEELLTWVKENYPVSNLNVLIGHSWGGLVVTQSFFQPNTKFEKFLAIDPSYWWDDNYFVDVLDSFPKIDLPKQKRLFISASSLQVEKESGKCCKHRNTIDLFYSNLKYNAANSEQINLAYFEDEDHASVPVPSTYYGLKFIFKDYPVKNVNEKSLEEIQKYFDNYYGIITGEKSVKIPEDLIRNVAQYRLYANNDVDAALIFYNYNIKHYPNSFKANSSISDAYLRANNKELAKKYLKIAVKLNPNFTEGIRKLKNLD